MKINGVEYMPFRLDRKGDRAYLMGKTIKLRNGYEEQETMIVGFKKTGSCTSAILSYPVTPGAGYAPSNLVKAEGLLQFFDYMNGKPVGVPVEELQI